MKKLLLICFTLFLILTSCEVKPILPENNEPLTVYDIEIGKFPGKKYTTFFEETKAYFSDGHGYIPYKDEYSPLNNEFYNSNYILEYANLNTEYYTFEFNGKEYSAYSVVPLYFNDFIPYYEFYKVVGQSGDDFLGVSIWGDTGKVRHLAFEETLKEDLSLSEEELKAQADSIASQYIDTTKYELVIEKQEKGNRTYFYYKQKINGLYIADPFMISYYGGANIDKIRFNRTGDDPGINFSLDSAKYAIMDKLSEEGLADYLVENSLEFVEIVIGKYDVPILISTATFSGINAEREESQGTFMKPLNDFTLTFYTKLCD